jgi:hypothetical protein
LVFDHAKPGHNPMCANRTMMIWMMGIMADKKPDIDRIGGVVHASRRSRR